MIKSMSGSASDKPGRRFVRATFITTSCSRLCHSGLSQLHHTFALCISRPSHAESPHVPFP